jgi:hypothetical protein
MTLKEIKGQVIVLLVTAIITFVAYSSQIGILWSFFGGATLHTALILIPFNVFVIMIYINYALTCLTDPGTVPPNWVSETKYTLWEGTTNSHPILLLDTSTTASSSFRSQTINTCTAILQNMQQL